MPFSPNHLLWLPFEAWSNVRKPFGGPLVGRALPEELTCARFKPNLDSAFGHALLWCEAQAEIS